MFVNTPFQTDHKVFLIVTGKIPPFQASWTGNNPQLKYNIDFKKCNVKAENNAKKSRQTESGEPPLPLPRDGDPLKMYLKGDFFRKSHFSDGAVIHRSAFPEVTTVKFSRILFSQFAFFLISLYI